MLRLITPNATNTVGTTPLDEGSVRRRDLCLTTHNTNKRERHTCSRRDSAFSSPKREATDTCLSPRGHRNRSVLLL